MLNETDRLETRGLYIASLNTVKHGHKLNTKLHNDDFFYVLVVALYLCGNWWHIDDVLRTSKKSRNGLEAVKCTIERVLVLVLSQLVDRVLAEEQLFSNHPPTENCKLLWIHGEAVAFYSFKHKGSLCENCISRCYELPVLDTIYVRGHCRRRGFGLLMLQDFCDMFPDESVLGVSSPLSAGMMAVCKKFLIQHKEHRDVLYEVEAPSSWIQRRNIWLNIQIRRYSRCKVITQTSTYHHKSKITQTSTYHHRSKITQTSTYHHKSKITQTSTYHHRSKITQTSTYHSEALCWSVLTVSVLA
uniref:Uncharacterized protein n=1 Tax=Periophthalmus magnuspinnatus TaxID=409849 RepID=A0A3B4A2T2_9GOBI